MSWPELIATWLPFVILLTFFVVLGVYLSRQYRSYMDHLNSVNALAEDSLRVNQELVDQAKEQTALLRDIKDELQK